MTLFRTDRLAETPGPVDRCLIFAWIGQSFAHCDNCSRPLEEHLYEPPYGSSRTLFWVKQTDYRGRWEWRAVGRLVRP